MSNRGRLLICRGECNQVLVRVLYAFIMNKMYLSRICFICIEGSFKGHRVTSLRIRMRKMNVNAQKKRKLQNMLCL